MSSKTEARTRQVMLGQVCLLLLALLTPATEAAERLGQVLEIEGVWTANGQMLKRGDAVTVPLELRAVAPNHESRIRILLSERNRVVPFDCKAADCNVPFKIPSEAAALGVDTSGRTTAAWKAIVAAVGEQFQLFPRRYSAHIARAGEMGDAIVLKRADAIDLRPALVSIAPGSYMIRLRPVATNGELGEPLAASEPYRWNPASPAPYEAILPAGARLFEATLLRNTGGVLRQAADPVWILACDESAFAAASQSFNEAVALTNDWRGDVDSQVKKEFVRAYLGHLAAQCGR